MVSEKRYKSFGAEVCLMSDISFFHCTRSCIRVNRRSLSGCTVSFIGVLSDAVRDSGVAMVTVTDDASLTTALTLMMEMCLFHDCKGLITSIQSARNTQASRQERSGDIVKYQACV